MRGEVVQKLGVDVASQRERSLCTCVARGGQCQLQPQCPCLCVHRRDKGITVLWVMDLEYTISTHSSLFILCCQGHRKPLHYLYISLLLRLGLSFSLLPSGWPRCPLTPPRAGGRASECVSGLLLRALDLRNRMDESVLSDCHSAGLQQQ